MLMLLLQGIYIYTQAAEVIYHGNAIGTRQASALMGIFQVEGMQEPSNIYTRGDDQDHNPNN